MIQINLLPGAKRKKAAASSGRKAVDFAAIGAMLKGAPALVKDKYLVGAVAALVLSIGAAGYMYLSQTKRLAALKAHVQEAVKDSTHYAKQQADLLRAVAKRDSLLREVNLIESIDQDRYVWPHILDEVSRALPQYTWLNSLAFTGPPQGAANVVASPPPAKVDSSAAGKKRRPEPKRLDTLIAHDPVTVRLAGNTVDIQAVMRFMSDLQLSGYFGGVTLDNTQSSTDQGKEVTAFQLTMSYARPDSMLRRVPLALTLSPPPGR